MSKYAMALVIDDQTDNTPSEADTYVWEEVVAALNPGNGFLAKGITCAFVGGPVAIHDREEYDTEMVAPYLAGTEKVAPPYEPRAWEQSLAEVAMGFGWLVEWDGGYATFTTHTTAIAVAGTVAEALEDEVRVSPNVPEPEAGAMGTSDGLGADPVSPDRQALMNIRQALREGLTPAQMRNAAVAEFERVGLLV